MTRTLLFVVAMGLLIAIGCDEGEYAIGDASANADDDSTHAAAGATDAGAADTTSDAEDASFASDSSTTTPPDLGTTPDVDPIVGANPRNACEDLDEGAPCAFTTPRGDVLEGSCADLQGPLECRPTGACAEEGDTCRLPVGTMGACVLSANGALICAPASAPGAPAQAACEEVALGEPCRFTTPQGEEIEGTCAEAPDGVVRCSGRR